MRIHLFYKGNVMKKFLLVALLALPQIALAAGSITILSPKEGATLPSGSGVKLEYNVTLSPDGNHVHVYVDNQDPIVDRNVHGCPCSIDLPQLSSGNHVIAVKEATVSHVLTGVESSVKFSVK